MKLALSLAVLATVVAAPAAVQAKSASEYHAEWLAKRAEWAAKWHSVAHVKPMVQKGKSSLVATDGGFKLILCERASGQKYLLDCSWE